jgi:Ni,Fe-hydrogenase III component G
MNTDSRQQAAAALAEFRWAQVIPETSRSRNELRMRVMPTEFLGLADYIRSRFNGSPELIVAEDTRQQTGGFAIHYVFEIPDQDLFLTVSTPLEPGQRLFPSLATRWYLASLFEREIQDLFGLIPSDHPDHRRLPLHQFWPAGYHPLLKDAVCPEDFRDDGQPFPFQQVQGEGIYQITVGPVHAGVIEPGHFRFSVDGETIVNLESRLYFLHKGIEKLFESKTLSRAVELAERVSGDCCVAHALAFCMALERCSAVEVPNVRIPASPSPTRTPCGCERTCSG